MECELLRRGNLVLHATSLSNKNLGLAHTDEDQVEAIHDRALPLIRLPSE